MAGAATLPGPGLLRVEDFGFLESSERALAGLTEGLARNFGLSDDAPPGAHPGVGVPFSGTLSTPDATRARAPSLSEAPPARALADSEAQSTRFAADGIVLSSVEAERLEEWTQSLFVLGYLSREAAVAADMNSEDLTHAAREFRDEIALIPDLFDAPVAAKDPGSLPTAEDPDRSEAVPTERELALISNFTSLDGDLKLLAMPAAGERNVFTRIVHFRLKALGLFEFDVARPFDEKTANALDSFAVLLVPCKPAELARPEGLESLEQAKRRERIKEWAHDITGDIKQIAHLYLEGHGHCPLFYRATDFPEAPAKSDYDKLYIETGKFKEVVWFDKYHDAERHEAVRNEIAERGHLEGRLYDCRNLFGLRLVQIKLWMYGYYDGLLDGRFGQESQSALRLALKTEGAALDDCLRSLKNGFEALNLAFLNRAIFALYEQPGPSADELVAALEKESSYLAGQGDDSNFAKIKRALGDAWGKVKRAARGAYRGAKSMFQTALRVLHRGYSWLVEWLGKLKAGIINFASALFGRLREGLRIIVRSAKAFFNFVLGRPVVTQDASGKPVAASLFNLDADVTTVFSSDASDNDIENHARRGIAFMRNASAFASVTVRIIGIIRDIALAGTPLSWISLAFRIAGMFHNQQPTATAT